LQNIYRKGETMTKEEHIQRHEKLHKYLDELVADWIDHTKSLPSKNTVFELLQWSNKQTSLPTERKP